MSIAAAVVTISILVLIVIVLLLAIYYLYRQKEYWRLQTESMGASIRHAEQQVLADGAAETQYLYTPPPPSSPSSSSSQFSLTERQTLPSFTADYTAI